MRLFFGLVLIALFDSTLHAEPDWSKGAMVPAGGRPNILDLEDQELKNYVHQGRLHALNYPVEVSGQLLPFDALERFFDEPTLNPLKAFLKTVFKSIEGIESFDEVQEWMGLYTYPEQDSAEIPLKNPEIAKYRMGTTKLPVGGANAFSVSCAQCHSANLFGTRVLGMTNPLTRANELFMKAQRAFGVATPGRFRWMTNASKAEMDLYQHSYHSMKFVGLKKPLALGLDTSLAQVALSLAKRAEDAYATREESWSDNPRKEPLAREPADSKPAVWWTLKYKNRWLSDGSLVSGNPIFTNFLWNEIGRGTDLNELEAWLESNSKTIDELTAAVFATEAPSYFDFFDAESFDLEAAQRGEQHFEKMCSKCHGQYIKGWSAPRSESKTRRELLETIFVLPIPSTPVVNVGTDQFRAKGMKSLEQLNRLEISKKYRIRIESQEGYVPPPLNGIWARWPYFHNNSAQSLCDVLSPAAERPNWYYLQPPRDKERDFDRDCNGYPRVSRRRRLKADRVIRLNRDGLRPIGHDNDIFVLNGVNQLNFQMRQELIRYLQTL